MPSGTYERKLRKFRDKNKQVDAESRYRCRKREELRKAGLHRDIIFGDCADDVV